MKEDEKIWLTTKEGQKFFIYKTEKCDMQKELTETIKNLQSQLKEKEEVIKEVKNIIKNNCIVLDSSYTEVVCTGEYLLEILSKGENK